MPFRDSTLALEHRLRLLWEERRAIDASIGEARRRLRQLRGPARRRVAWRAVLIVVLLLALLAPFLALATGMLCRVGTSPELTARIDTSTIGHAAGQYAVELPGAGCPTTRSLIKEGFIDDNNRVTDPWDNDFRIDCAGDEIKVASAGPDGRFGTDDDITSNDG